MRSSPRILVMIALCALAGTGSAQAVPSGTWLIWGILGAGCSPCGLDADLNSLWAFNDPWVGDGVTARHPSGFVLCAAIDKVFSYDAAGPFGPPLVMPSSLISGLGVDPQGGLWVLSGSVVAGSWLHHVGGGVIDQTQLLSPGQSFQALSIDRAGRAWVASRPWFGGDGELWTVDLTGAVAGPRLAANGGRFVVAAGPDGGAFAIEKNGAASQLLAFDGMQVERFSVPLPDALGIEVNACGLLLVLRDGAPQVVELRSPADGALLSSTPLQSATGHDSITLDSKGVLWAQSADGVTVETFHADGSLRATLGTYGTRAFSLGDATGYHLASIADPSGDADLDGVPNRLELQRGSDPYDANSSPAQLQLSGTPAPAQSFQVSGSFPGEAGLPYVLAASFGNDGILVAPCRLVPLSADPVLDWWLSPANTVTSGVFGVLDAAGTGTASVSLPAMGSLAGLDLWFAMASFDAYGLPGSVSEALRVPLL